MKAISTLILVLLATATTLSAGVHMTQYQEIVLDESIDATGRQYLTDIDGDGYLDILFNTNTKIGWYSGGEAIVKSSIGKRIEVMVPRSYIAGQFDNDNALDYAEIVIGGDDYRDFFTVFYLSSHLLSGNDTVYIGHLEEVLQPDPFHNTGFLIMNPSVYDLNEDGIDELYTGYYYYRDICDIFFCYHVNPEYHPVSFQFGDTELGSLAVAPSSYDLFTQDGYTNPSRLLIGQYHNWGSTHGSGSWDYEALTISSYNESDSVTGALIETDQLCMASGDEHKLYAISLESYQLVSASEGFGSPLLVMRTNVYTESSDAEPLFCWESRSELMQVDLTETDSLAINWREVAPDWATSDIIFADTSSPGQVFLSDGERIFQVREQTFEKLDSSEVLNLSGHMVGYKPIVAGQAPSLVLTDGDRVRFFRFDIVTDVDDDTDAPNELPDNFVLAQNYPNPFNPTTEISFTLAQGAHVKLTVYNSLGQVVTELTDQFYSAGTHTVEWNGTDAVGHAVASGLYFYRLMSGDIVASKKMLLLK